MDYAGALDNNKRRMWMSKSGWLFLFKIILLPNYKKKNSPRQTLFWLVFSQFNKNLSDYCSPALGTIISLILVFDCICQLITRNYACLYERYFGFVLWFFLSSQIGTRKITTTVYQINQYGLYRKIQNVLFFPLPLCTF